MRDQRDSSQSRLQIDSIVREMVVPKNSSVCGGWEERRDEREMRVNHKNIHTCTHMNTHTYSVPMRSEKGWENSASKLLFLNTYATPGPSAWWLQAIWPLQVAVDDRSRRELWDCAEGNYKVKENLCVLSTLTAKPVCHKRRHSAWLDTGLSPFMS